MRNLVAHARNSAPWLPPVACCALVGLLVWWVWEFRIVADATQSVPLNNYDLYAYYYPAYEFAAGMWRAGLVPMWNSYQLNGLPALATAQNGALYPPHIVYLLMPTATGMAVMAVLHLALATIFATVLGRALQLTWPGAAVTGLAFGLSSSVVSMVCWPPLQESMIWLPLLLAASEHMLARNASRWVAAVAVAVAMAIYAGGLQIVAYSAWALGIYLVMRGAQMWRGGTDGLTVAWRAVAIVIAALVGVALSGPQLLPTLELAAQSTRPTAAMTAKQINPMGLGMAWDALAAQAVRVPAQWWPPYVGAVPLVLAALAFVPRRDAPATGVLGWALAMAAWGTLGVTAPPWFVELQARVPLVSWFRNPFRAFMLTSLAVAVLAGIGMDRLRGGAASKGGTVTLSLVGVLVTLFAWLRFPATGWWLVPLLLPAASLARRPGYAVRAGSAALVALLTWDLAGLSSNRIELPSANDSWRHVWQHEAVLRAVQQRAGLDRTLMAGGVWPGWYAKNAMLAGILSPIDYEPMALRAYADFFAYASWGGLWASPLPFVGDYPAEPTPVARRFLQLLSIRYVAIYPMALAKARAEGWTDGLVPVPLLDENVGDNIGFTLFEDPRALPRAYGVYEAECLPQRRAQLARLASDQFDSRRTVVLEGRCDRQSRARAPASDVAIEEYTDTRVRMTARMARPGFVVLTDSYYPGWRAVVNGRPVPILRANVVVRAVEVPAGESTIEFRYVPQPFFVGIATAGAAIVVGGLWTWRSRRRRP